QKFTHHRCMYGVAAFFGCYLSFKRHTQKREIADDVENLMADEFVVEPERVFVKHSVGRKHDSAVERSAEREVCLSQHFYFVRKTKSACRRDLAAERTILENEVELLPVDVRMRKIDHAFDLVFVSWFGGHFAVAVGEFDLLEDAKIPSLGGLFCFCGGSQKLDPICA